MDLNQQFSDSLVGVAEGHKAVIDQLEQLRRDLAPALRRRTDPLAQAIFQWTDALGAHAKLINGLLEASASECRIVAEPVIPTQNEPRNEEHPSLVSRVADVRVASAAFYDESKLFRDRLPTKLLDAWRAVQLRKDVLVDAIIELAGAVESEFEGR